MRFPAMYADQLTSVLPIRAMGETLQHYQGFNLRLRASFLILAYKCLYYNQLVNPLLCFSLFLFLSLFLSLSLY